MDVIETFLAGHSSITETKDLIDKLDSAMKNDPSFWQGAASAANFFKREVQRHIELEEKVLFPVMLKYFNETGCQYVLMLLSEHPALTRELECVARLSEGIAENRTQKLKDALLESYSHMIDLLLPHAKKEDALLFPLMKQNFPPAAYKELEKLYFEYIEKK